MHPYALDGWHLFSTILPCIAGLADAAALKTLSSAEAVPRARLNGAIWASEALDAYTLAGSAQFPGPAAPWAGTGGGLFLPTVLAAVARAAHARSLHTPPTAPAVGGAGAGGAGGSGVA